MLRKQWHRVLMTASPPGVGLWAECLRGATSLPSHMEEAGGTAVCWLTIFSCNDIFLLFSVGCSRSWAVYFTKEVTVLLSEMQCFTCLKEAHGYPQQVSLSSLQNSSSQCLGLSLQLLSSECPEVPLGTTPVKERFCITKNRNRMQCCERDANALKTGWMFYLAVPETRAAATKVWNYGKFSNVFSIFLFSFI